MKIVELEKVAAFVNGYPFKPTDWGSNGLKIIRIQNLTNTKKAFNRTTKTVPDKYLIKKGDILVSWSATLDVFEWEDEENALLNQHIFKVEPDFNVIDKRYFKYALRYSIQKMSQFTHGSTMKHIVRKDFLNHHIPLPSLEEQKRIIKVLNEASSLCHKRKQSISLLDEYLKSLFFELFGDPVKNDKSWASGTIGDLVFEVKYGTSAVAGTNGDFPYLRMNNITYSGELDISNLKYINLKESEKEKYLAKKGDILFNRTNSKELVGKTAVYNLAYPMAVAGYLIRVRTNDKALPEYISGYLNSKHGKITLEHMCKNIVGMANINAKELQKIHILIPPLHLQNKYKEILYKKCELKQKMLNQSEELEKQFQALMQKSFE